jgi:heme exporter protein CcmD
MSEFFSMGGYALFVWPAYAVTLLAIVVNVYTAHRDLQSARIEARRRVSTDSMGDPVRGQP